MLRAVIFDMDGLLVDSEAIAAQAMDDFLARYGFARRPEIHSQLLGRRLTDALHIVKEGYAMPEPVDDLIAIYAGMRLAALSGRVRPMPGALEIVAFAREAGLRIAVASSGMREHVTLSLAETGLAGRFDAEVTGEEVRQGKPAPDLFLRAAELLGVAPADAVVFEDAPNGVAAAVAAGIWVAAIPERHGGPVEFPVPPDVTLPDLHAAIGWLRTLGAGAAIPS
ncbi:MAG: HAD family hydrolase [Thermomicrobiales bacterium]